MMNGATTRIDLTPADDAYEEFDIISNVSSANATPIQTHIVEDGANGIDEDGFATVIIRDTAITHTFHTDEEDEAEEDADDTDEDEPERIPSLITSEDEFIDIDQITRTQPPHTTTNGHTATQTRILPTHSSIQHQIGGSESSSSSDEEEDDTASEDENDTDEEVDVRVERIIQPSQPAIITTARDSSSTSEIIDRIMQHHAASFTPAFITTAPIANRSIANSFARHHAITGPPSASSVSLDPSFQHLRALLADGMDESIARLRTRAAQRIQEIESENIGLTQQSVELDDLFSLIPDPTSGHEEKQSEHEDQTQLHDSTRIPHMNEEEQEQFLEEAAMMAAEMTDSEEENEEEKEEEDYADAQTTNRTNLRTSQLQFSNLANISHSNDDLTSSSPQSTTARLARYAQSDTNETAANTLNHQAARSESSLPSASAARRGLFLPTTTAQSSSQPHSSTPASSESQRVSTRASSTTTSVAPSSHSSSTSNIDAGTGALPSSLFTSDALSFLNFTPGQVRRLHQQFAREQSTFEFMHENTRHPDSNLPMIEPVGKDQLDPSQFRS